MKTLEINFNSTDKADAKQVKVEKGKIDYDFLLSKYLDVKVIEHDKIEGIFFDSNHFPEKEIKLSIGETTQIFYPVGGKMQRYYLKLVEKDFSVKNLSKSLGK